MITDRQDFIRHLLTLTRDAELRVALSRAAFRTPDLRWADLPSIATRESRGRVRGYSVFTSPYTARADAALCGLILLGRV